MRYGVMNFPVKPVVDEIRAAAGSGVGKSAELQDNGRFADPESDSE